MHHVTSPASFVTLKSRCSGLFYVDGDFVASETQTPLLSMLPLSVAQVIGIIGFKNQLINSIIYYSYVSLPSKGLGAEKGFRKECNDYFETYQRRR